MKIKLENREYDFKANGRFMKKYQDTFKENLILALYKVSTEKDIYTCAKIIYCGIDEELSFEDWLDSYESPLFTLGAMDTVMEYITRSIEPTVESKGEKSDLKKKTK